MSFNTALTGLNAAANELDVIGNNISNSNTTGFKRSRADFKDIYAASSLGASSNSIGAGVHLAAVEQMFDRGPVEFTENNLDLAINGSGFFVLSSGGSTVYTRAGAFHEARDGTIVDSNDRAIQGFQADKAGNIGGTLGNIVVDGSNQSPQPTQTVTFAVNLNSSDTLPIQQWLGTSNWGDALPGVDTYNNSTSSTIYDSLGNAHTLSTYFVKTPVANEWDVRVQIDGIDVSTSDAKPNSYTTPADPLANSNGIPVITSTDLTIDGVPIPVPSSDGVSTTDSSASAIALANAINSVNGTTGVTASVNPTTLNLGLFTPGSLSGSDFSVNGVNIAATDTTSLLNAINAISGISAVDVNGDIVLTAADGRNIQIATSGNVQGPNFSNFNLAGIAKNQVQSATYTLSASAPIIIGGDSPSTAGLYRGTLYPPFREYFNSDGSFNAALSEPIEISWAPLNPDGLPNGAVNPQKFAINLDTSTQFGSAFAVHESSQDGYTTGELDTITVESNGIVYGRYTNGQAKALGQVALANFANVQGLQPLGDTCWGETFTSGTALLGAPGTSSLGLVQSGALESSNVNLTQELVNLIVAQRDFQANAQSIRTEDAVTQTIINIR